MESLVFEKGCLCEDYPWKITFDEVFGFCESTVCKHCVEAPPPDPRYPDKYYRCPRAVVAFNEGRCNSTAVCLDCILEAAKGL